MSRRSTKTAQTHLATISLDAQSELPHQSDTTYQGMSQQSAKTARTHLATISLDAQSELPHHRDTTMNQKSTHRPSKCSRTVKDAMQDALLSIGIQDAEASLLLDAEGDEHTEAVLSLVKDAIAPST
jgi:hypothetical protein